MSVPLWQLTYTVSILSSLFHITSHIHAFAPSDKCTGISTPQLTFCGDFPPTSSKILTEYPLVAWLRSKRCLEGPD